MTLTLGSHFDGISAFPYAASFYGIKAIWATEIEPFPVAVSKHHFPHVRHYGDISRVNGAELEPVDIITFGSPCQDMSVAGKREGLYGERSGLFMEAVRTIREMREATSGAYPRYAIWENVPGAFSSNGGLDFKAVLEEITETEIPMPQSGKWATAGMVRGDGYSVAWRVLDAQYFGVPQRRRRIFLIADFNGQRAPEILFECEGVSGNLTESGKAREEVAAGAGDGVKKTSRIDCTDGGIAGTVSSKWAKGTGGPAGDEHYNLILFEPRSQDGVPRIHKEVFPILNTAQGGQRQPCIAFQPGNLSRRAGAEPSEKAFPTLGATTQGDQFPHIAFTQNQRNEVRDLKDKAGCLAAEPGMKQQTYVAKPIPIINKDKPAYTGYAVRRLTPTEAERLMGFPDGWTDGGSDTARYKALGNSIAVPCLKWIFSQLVRT
jgi:DNA (cytosine-5)-methyltransferase 1